LINRKHKSRSPFWMILSTFIIALLLNMFPYPDWMKYAKPDWVLLVLFYWCLAVPERVGVGCGWLVGLAMDVLYYSLMGQHAIGKTFVALIGVYAHRRLRLYELWQQCIVVFVVATIDIAFTVWIYNITAGVEVRIIYWQSALTTCLIWPVIYTLLRQLRHRSGIS
jgi:rod shape-determining protein MreD